MGQGFHLSLQILNIKLFGLDSVLPGGRGFERGNGGHPPRLRFHDWQHGSSRETISHGWRATQSILADAVCATGNFHY